MTIGSVPSSSSRVMSLSASSPIACRPASCQLFSARLRFVALATGSLAAAPALVRQATAVTDPRERIVPVRALGKQVDPSQVGAYLVIARLQANRTGPKGEIDEGLLRARSALWRLYEPG